MLALTWLKSLELGGTSSTGFTISQLECCYIAQVIYVSSGKIGWCIKYSREVVIGLPDVKVEQQGVCKGCVLGRYAKTVFPSCDRRSKGILDLIHSNVGGPMSTMSLNGYHYYVIFIDDFSRHTWIYFMKTKDEVLSRLQKFKALV